MVKSAPGFSALCKVYNLHNKPPLFCLVGYTLFTNSKNVKFSLDFVKCTVYNTDIKNEPQRSKTNRRTFTRTNKQGRRGARCTPKDQRFSDRTKGSRPDQGNRKPALIKMRPNTRQPPPACISPVRAAPVVMSAYIRQKENCKPVLGCTNSHRTYKKDN